MHIPTIVGDAFAKWTGRQSANDLSTAVRFPDAVDVPLDSRRLIRNRRYCNVLSKHCELEFDSVSLECARKALEHDMAYVPQGIVRLMQDVVVEEDRRYRLKQSTFVPVQVESFFLDRDCVTNADYARFVQAGGYEDHQYWPQETLAWVLQFVDRTGHVGPNMWSHGQPPADLLDHPVVGICWYEANAYARWVGKRLPTTAEWQRAGTWPHMRTGAAAEQRFPWGNAFVRSKANLWKHGGCATIPVDALNDGNTPNGVRQLIGNVWEWLDSRFDSASEGDVKIILEEVLAEVRGGAFDTYFASQATCQFRTGQPVLNRPHNVGFRCCISATDLRSSTENSENN